MEKNTVENYIPGDEKLSDKDDSDRSDSTMGEIAIGDSRSSNATRSDDIGAANSQGYDDQDDIDRPAISRLQTGNSVPASIMSHPAQGTDLEKGLTGPKNMSMDENGMIVVNWTSKHDPENPKNWPRKKKIFNVVIISLMTFLCPLCSAMFVRPLHPPLPPWISQFTRRKLIRSPLACHR